MQRWPVLSAGLYALLIGAGVYHVVCGVPKLMRAGRRTRRAARRAALVCAGILAAGASRIAAAPRESLFLRERVRRCC